MYQVELDFRAIWYYNHPLKSNQTSSLTIGSFKISFFPNTYIFILHKNYILKKNLYPAMFYALLIILTRNKIYVTWH